MPEETVTTRAARRFYSEAQRVLEAAERCENDPGETAFKLLALTVKSARIALSEVQACVTK